MDKQVFWREIGTQADWAVNATREIGTQADWASMNSANDHAFELMKNLISKEVFLRSQRKA